MKKYKDFIKKTKVEITEEISTFKQSDLMSYFIKNNMTLRTSLLEKYENIIINDFFDIDPIVQDFKVSNSEGKVKYKLLDESIVYIEEDTQELLIKLLSDKRDIVEYMQLSSNNFMEVIRGING